MQEEIFSAKHSINHTYGSDLSEISQVTYEEPMVGHCSNPLGEGNFASRFAFVPPKVFPYMSMPRDTCADRFIPVRNMDFFTGMNGLDLDMPVNPIDNMADLRTEQELNSLKYQILLRGNFEEPASSSHASKKMKKKSSHFGGYSKLLQFQTPSKRESNIDLTAMEFPFSFKNDNPILSTSINRTKIAEKPFKVLDTPLLDDDFYLNPIDWSRSDLLAVSLKDSIYLWSGLDGSVKKLCKLSTQGETYSSVNWSPDGDILAAGTSTGRLELWDRKTNRLLRSDLEPHSDRIGCLAWLNPNILSSGSKDSSITLRDLRVQENQGSVMKFKGHKQEVCSLKWSPNNFQLASGGNDHKLFIWNMRKSKPEARFNEHKAAIKALAWSPNQSGLLISGGGNNDKTIKVWNTLLMKNMMSVNVESQVCNLLFSPNANEFVSTHGFPNNEVTVWKFPEFTKLKTLEGHKNRVIYLTLSPDGEKIVTGAGGNDGSLRFWKVFPPAAVNQEKAATALCSSEFR